jgi:hypothetical protein
VAAAQVVQAGHGRLFLFLLFLFASVKEQTHPALVVVVFDLFTLLRVGLDFSPLTIITLQVGSRTEHRQMKSVYTLQLETMSAGTTRARVNALFDLLLLIIGLSSGPSAQSRRWKRCRPTTAT